jgi:hypothetical protein
VLPLPTWRRSSSKLDRKEVEVRRFSRRTTIVTVGMALVVATSVIAYAFWTGVGAGTGNAQTGNTGQPLVVNQLGTPTGLVPGGPAASLSGNFDNPNAAPVFVNQVTATVGTITPAQADGSKPPCTAADFSVGGTANVNAQIPPGSGQGNWSGLTLSLLNTATNQDNCKNVTVQINYTTT